MQLVLRVFAALSAIVLVFSTVPVSAFMWVGSKWEPGPNMASFGPPGTPGSATWSLMGPGLSDASGFDAHGGAMTIDFTTLTTSDELALIDMALNVWDAVSGFTNLGMVADGGVGFGAPETMGGHLGDIRIGAIAFDGAFGVLAHNFIPGTEALFGAGGTIAGDSHYDKDETWVDDPMEDGMGPEIDLLTVLIHEFGHALGLDHSAVPGSVMEPFYAGARRTLHADDIAGITFIYGPQVATPEPGTLTLLGLGLAGLVVMARRRKK